MTSPTYDPAYYDHLDGPARAAAAVVVPLVADLVRPRSVVDVGCGSGAWLAAFAERGAEVVGVDGPWVEGGLPVPGLLVACDLETASPDLGRRFDLAVSLEVAEHLSPHRAAPFVEALTALSDVVLFSAAIPGQGGRDHRNEQWPSYWADRFGAVGYVPLDVLRPQVWDCPEVAWWYRQNVLLYVAEAALGRLRELAPGGATAPSPLALVHPDRFEQERADLAAARGEAAASRDERDRYRDWVDHLQAEDAVTRQRVAELAEWGAALEQEADRLRSLAPGAVPLRTVLGAVPGLIAHAVRTRV